VKGVGLKFDREEKGIVTLWCKTGFCSLYKDNIIALKCGKKVYSRT
jgi:ABC-type enterochelin transport system ATPase subunit